MAISLVQHVFGTNNAAGNNTIGTLGANVTAGNLLVLAFNVFTGTINSISDSLSNSYTVVGTGLNANDRSYIYYVPNCAGGSWIGTVVCDSDHVRSMGVYEYSGAATSLPLDQSSKGSANSSVNVNPGTLTPNQNNSLIVSLGGDFVVGGNGTVIKAASFTLEDSQYSTTGERYYFEDFVQGAAGAVSGSFTLANAASSRSIQAIFKPQPVVASPNRYRALMGVGA